jgi:hypothetical protein
LNIVRNKNGRFAPGNYSGNKFEKGNIPWNKDKYVHLCPETEFKKGITTMENNPSWKGGIQHPKNDCVHVAIATNIRIRRPRLIYEKEIGPIPKGYIVLHKDGNKDNDDKTNLMAISRAELIKINRR